MPEGSTLDRSARPATASPGFPVLISRVSEISTFPHMRTGHESTVKCQWTEIILCNINAWIKRFKCLRMKFE
jgi:hypothetical protein